MSDLAREFSPIGRREEASCAGSRRKSIESFAWPSRQFTARCGVSTRSASIDQLARLIDGADLAPHTSNQAGRNRGTHLGMIEVKEPFSSTRSESSPGLERPLRVVARGIGQKTNSSNLPHGEGEPRPC